MVKLMEDYPADMEARAFAALSILGLNRPVRDVSAYMRAAAMWDRCSPPPVTPRGGALPHPLLRRSDSRAPGPARGAGPYSRIAPRTPRTRST